MMDVKKDNLHTLISKRLKILNDTVKILDKRCGFFLKNEPGKFPGYSDEDIDKITDIILNPKNNHLIVKNMDEILSLYLYYYFIPATNLTYLILNHIKNPISIITKLLFYYDILSNPNFDINSYSVFVYNFNISKFKEILTEFRQDIKFNKYTNDLNDINKIMESISGSEVIDIIPETNFILEKMKKEKKHVCLVNIILLIKLIKILWFS